VLDCLKTNFILNAAILLMCWWPPAFWSTY